MNLNGETIHFEDPARQIFGEKEMRVFVNASLISFDFKQAKCDENLTEIRLI